MITQAQLLADFKRVLEYEYDGLVGLDSTDEEILRALDKGVVDLARNNPVREFRLPITLPPDQNVVDLAHRAITGGRVVFRVRKVLLGNRITQTELGKPGLLRMDVFESLYPDWQAVPPGDVVDIAFSNPTTLLFYPAPTAEFLADNEAAIDADVSPILPSMLEPNDDLGVLGEIAPHVISAAMYLNSSLMTMTAPQRLALNQAYVDAQRATNRAIVGKMANKGNPRDPRAAERFRPKTVEL